jgi:hypothetical protein
MHPYNNKPKDDERGNLSFSFLSNETVTAQSLLAKTRSSLQLILNRRFSNSEKREVYDKHGRLNFACPYCGDSHEDSRKKRGNLYYGASFYYKCYNCNKYRSIDQFLKDFSETLNADEIVLAREMEKKEISGKIAIDPMLFLDKANLMRYAIDREVIEEKQNLVPLDRSKIYIYLQKRLQPVMGRFSWNEEKQQLYIFHLIPDTNKVLGFQIRNFKSTPKYLTFKLSKIYENLKMEIPDEVYEIDDISTTFGILSIDMSQPVTVFEGPLDSFLMKNSVATCSSGIDFPINLGTLRYMYDYDRAGREASLKKAGDGKPVFLWKKLLTDVGITEPVKKMDLTDLLVYCKRKGVKLPKLSEYFSRDKYDIYHI